MKKQEKQMIYISPEPNKFNSSHHANLSIKGVKYK